MQTVEGNDKEERGNTRRKEKKTVRIGKIQTGEGK